MKTQSGFLKSSRLFISGVFHPSSGMGEKLAMFYQRKGSQCWILGGLRGHCSPCSDKTNTEWQQRRREAKKKHKTKQNTRHDPRKEWEDENNRKSEEQESDRFLKRDRWMAYRRRVIGDFETKRKQKEIKRSFYQR